MGLSNQLSAQISAQISSTKSAVYLHLIKSVFSFSHGRDLLMKKVDKELYSSLVEKNKKFLKNSQMKKYEFLMSMLESSKRNFEKKIHFKGICQQGN